jgi:hypothetical protein
MPFNACKQHNERTMYMIPPFKKKTRKQEHALDELKQLLCGVGLPPGINTFPPTTMQSLSSGLHDTEDHCKQVSKHNVPLQLVESFVYLKVNYSGCNASVNRQNNSSLS